MYRKNKVRINMLDNMVIDLRRVFIIVFNFVKEK